MDILWLTWRQVLTSNHSHGREDVPLKTSGGSNAGRYDMYYPYMQHNASYDLSRNLDIDMYITCISHVGQQIWERVGEYPNKDHSCLPGERWALTHSWSETHDWEESGATYGSGTNDPGRPILGPCFPLYEQNDWLVRNHPPKVVASKKLVWPVYDLHCLHFIRFLSSAVNPRSSTAAGAAKYVRWGQAKYGRKSQGRHWKRCDFDQPVIDYPLSTSYHQQVVDKKLLTAHHQPVINQLFDL